MKRAVSLLLTMVPLSAWAEVLFFGGSINPETTQSQMFFIAGPGESGIGVFDDFRVTSPTWRVESVSLFILSSAGVSTNLAQFEIRSGVSEGNAGTLIAENQAIAMTSAATGRTILGRIEYKLSVSGLSIDLEKGRYWLMFKPFTSVYTGPTSGADGIGTPLGNGETYARSVFAGYNYRSLSTLLTPNPYDLSFEVQGTAVPEPATLVALSIGAVLLRRRDWKLN